MKGDLGNEELLDRLFEKYRFDSVMHFAGSIVVPESVENPAKYYENNTYKSYAFIKKCLHYGVQNFIFSSTCAVYGHAESAFIREEHPVNPLSPYARSKLAIEWFLEDFSRGHPEFRYVILRYFNVAGADLEGKIGQSSPEATHLIKLCLQAALKMRDKLLLFGTDYNTADGTCIRDYIHVEDLAVSHLKALDFLKTEKTSTVFNCGYGHGYSVREVIAMAQKVTGVDFAVEEVARRPGDCDRLVAGPEKIKSLLDVELLHDNLEKIIYTAYRWEQTLQQRITS